jgi:hypothetical protein
MRAPGDFPDRFQSSVPQFLSVLHALKSVQSKFQPRRPLTSKIFAVEQPSQELVLLTAILPKRFLNSLQPVKLAESLCVPGSASVLTSGSATRTSTVAGSFEKF